ncbi:MAG: acyl carrier protein [Acidobacteriia bacterium]|nr:acyl carrier protein [Terriglobia bacterium]
MTAGEVLKSFTQILRDLLGDDSIVLSPSTRRIDVSGWDSFNYVNFVVAVEMKFGVKFGVAEVESFQTVGEIVQRTLALLQASPR